MTTSSILGIDAAWTEREPSGVALVRGEGEAWDVVCVAPSYGTFVASGDGNPVDWSAAGPFVGSWPDLRGLVRAARALANDPLCIVAIDMPMATVPITSRRAADSAVSKAFGAGGCSTHSPSPVRPGRLGKDLTDQLLRAGFPLATATANRLLPCALEVYPHPALLTLLGCDERVRYKVRRSSRYWPHTTVAERVSRLLEQFDRINAALGAVMGGAPLQLPAAARTRSLAELKRYEDALDALISAWVGARYSTGQAAAYGDETAAIWIPPSDA